ncbi:MAG: antitoxin component YwqK of YwqJK toxin-antitoxin module [Salibacteraceae bacterium]|jgi:antitoxin component YwqK of YwqJK toxin-antitoxin module
MTAEELKSHNARLKMEDEKQKLRSQAAKTASKEKLAKWKSDQKKATEEAIKEDAKNTIHLTGSDDEGNAVKSNYYYPTKSQAQLQAEENTRRTNNAMNNVNYYLDKIATTNRAKIDAREKREAELAAEARVQKIQYEYKEELRELRVNNAGTYSNGVAPTLADGGYVYIDNSGQVIIPGKFDYARSFSKGLARVTKNNKTGIIDTYGSYVIPLKYDFLGDFNHGLALAENNNKYGFIDIHDNVIIPLIYDGIRSSYTSTEYGDNNLSDDELFWVEKDGKYGWIDINNEVLVPFIASKSTTKYRAGTYGELINRSRGLYDEVYDYHEGLALVRKGFYGYEGTVDEAVFGYIDQAGNQVIALTFKDASDFSEGLASASSVGYGKRKTGCIDYSGNIVLPFEYDYIERFKNGNAVASIDNKCGIINKKGSIIVPLEYAVLSEVSDLLFRAKLTNDGDWGLIDINNKVIVPFIFDGFEGFENGTARVGVPVDYWWKTEWFYIDKKGNCVKDCDKDPRNPVEKILETDEVKEYYENGQLSSIGRKDKEEWQSQWWEIGEWKYYYENGQLKVIGSYKKVKTTDGYERNEKSSEWKTYYENGKLSSIGIYEKGKKTGEWRTYYKNGQLEEIKTWLNGKVNGGFKTYLENGQLKRIGRIENNERLGEWKVYHDNGQLLQEGIYENGRKTGEWKTYYDNGQVSTITEKKNGKANGEFKSYHRNGQLKSIGSAVNGEYSGELKEYNENGELVKTKNY